MNSLKDAFGLELLMDLSGCDVERFNRKDIKRYFVELCKLIDMKRCKLVFWDDKWTWLWRLLFFWDRSIRPATEVHTKGTTAIQFIITSGITIHTLDLIEVLFIDVFSCKAYDPAVVKRFTEEFFGGKIDKATLIERGTGCM